MPDSLVRNPDMDFANAPDAPPATVIACGHVLGDAPRAVPPALHCFQALGPWGEPDAGLPWLRIGPAEGPVGAGGAPSSAAEPLAAILHRCGGLLLVVGSDHDSLALALAIGTYARSRGIRVTALLAGRTGRPRFPRRALLRCADHVCECPAGQDPLQAAQALCSGAGQRHPGRAGDFASTPSSPVRPGQN